MRIVFGALHKGNGDFTKRMTKFRDVFKQATGQDLFPGTLNVRVGEGIEIKEHFRIRGSELGEPDQDLLFEICRVNDVWAYRIRPYNLKDGSGGHGDDTIEIACDLELRKQSEFDEAAIKIAFFSH